MWVSVCAPTNKTTTEPDSERENYSKAIRKKLQEPQKEANKKCEKETS